MKRPPPNSDAEAASSVSKKRRHLSVSDDDDGLKMCSTPGFNDLDRIYNRKGSSEQPGELFRKDLISKMKLPDNEQLDENDFWDVTDSWKQEWERGVQIPVHTSVPEHKVRVIKDKRKISPFKLPKKFLRTVEDDFFSSDHHVLAETGKKAEKICKYDLDDLDSHWLQLFNERRSDFGLANVTEETLELVLEDFETHCSNRFQDALKTEKGLGIEYDEDVICDVCRSPECEEGNEMVFCDACNICVHQACYGITAIPEGSWVCRPCALNVKPSCILCPNPSGAMKSTSSGERWAHVSCALWIPEVIIGCPERMEPIMHISHIPASRWALICTLCRERVGACIQCSVKQCKVAYHVTCAFEHGLEMEMKTTATDSNEESVKMQSFCAKHSKNDVLERTPTKVAKSPRKPPKKKREIKTAKEPECKDEVDEHNARLQKIRSLEAQFHKFVNIKDTAELLNVDIDIVDLLYYFWVLKRRTKFNKPLLITKCDEANQLIKQHENLLYSRLKMFVHLRQDLERVRNLCYMVGRREKISRSYIRMKLQVLEKQNEILGDHSIELTDRDIKYIQNARTGDPIYDHFYCVVFDKESDDENTDEEKSVLEPKPSNPYAKNYSNNITTRSRRRTASHGTLEDSNSAFDNETREMPVLTKCKSEENLSQEDKKQKITFTHSPFVIKVAPKLDDENDAQHECKPLDEPHSKVNKEENGKIDNETKYLDALNVVSENTSEKVMNNSNEASSDKNSLCLSDKENINALAPIKIKKTRNQGETRHTEFKNVIQEYTTQKSNIFDEDSCLSMNSELCASEDKMSRRNTRYQMRSRNYNDDVIEIDDTSFKSADSINIQTSHQIQPMCSPTNSVQEISFISQNESLSEDKTVHTTPTTVPRKRRGRPPKVRRKISIVNNFSEIDNENAMDTSTTNSFNNDSERGNNCLNDLDRIPQLPGTNVDKSSSFSDIIDLSDSNESTRFKMSLRHSREHLTPIRKPLRKKTSKTPEFEQNSNHNVSNRSCDSSPIWNSDSSPKSSPDGKPSTRIIIRLRKDPNRESWKNDSSSDGNVAFRIVHSNVGVVNGDDQVSHFPSIIKDEDSTQSEIFNEARHRYPMRDRPILIRTAKCNTNRS